MNLQPTTVAAVPEAPVCPAGQSPVFRFQDDMEGLQTAGQWSIAHTVGSNDWSVADFYATSGRQSLWGPDLNVSADMTAFRTADLVPEVGRTTYLWFRHAYDFESNWDGGVVELSTNGGSTWTDAGPLFTHQGYRFGNIHDSAGTALAGRPAFTNTIGGYTSSRIDLSSLAGQNVRYRFRVVTDSSVGRWGWFVDDVWVYTCGTGVSVPGAPTAVTATAGDASAVVSWTAPAADGGSAVTSFIISPFANNGTTPGTPTTVTSGSATAATVNGLSNGTPYAFTVAASNAVGTGEASARSNVVTPAGVPLVSGARYHPLTPARILDTRTGNGAPAAALGAGGTVDLQVTGRGGVPASGVSAVVMNVTVAGATAPASFLTAFPSGEARPLASNLNFAAGDVVPNLVVVKLGAGGRVSLYNAAGDVEVIADVAGWYDDGTAAAGARYHPLTPARILDTRTGNGAPAAALGAGGTVDLQVTGQGGVPASGVSAVVMNVTVAGATAPASFLTAFPSGEARPLASNLNFAAGEVVPNLVVVKLGAGGRVSLYNAAGDVEVIADVAGWYDAG